MSDDDTKHKAARTRGRRALFSLVAVAIPVIFFVVLEGALRIAGQRQVYPLFITSPTQPAYKQANPEVVKRFFTNTDRAPMVMIETSYFRAEKPVNGLRIVVQGGSSAAGFPYGYGASLAGMLAQRLRHTIPNLPVEVVSTSMAAVNSYALLDFADEVIAQKPNVVLIYAGHNEYLGILGVGSVASSGLSPALTRLTMRLRRFAVYQLFERLIGRGAPDANKLHDAAGQTLMARIAAEKVIPYGSPVFKKGIEQFRGNLIRLLAKYRRAGIPVIIGTLVSNEADLAPFAGAPEPGADPDHDEIMRDARESLAAGDLEQARLLLDATLTDDGPAEAWYESARIYAATGDNAAARERFLAAKDRDQLRFRAPEAFNDVIRETAHRYGATVADVQRAFVNAAPDGVIGNEFMLEHVHPNLDGYFLLADAYFDALFEAGMLVTDGELPSDADARRRIPVSEVDRLFGEYKLKNVMSDWPFVAKRREPEIPPPTNDIENLSYQMYERRIRWPQAMSQLLKHYRAQGNSEEELRVALILADALPFVPGAQFAAGTALIAARRPREALRYLALAEDTTPNDVNVLLAYGHALILTGAYGPARIRLDRVLGLDPNNATARNALAELDKRVPH